MDYLGIIVTFTYEKNLGLCFERKAQKTVVYNYCKDVIIENNRLTFKYLDCSLNFHNEDWNKFDMSLHDIKRCHFMGGC